MNGQKHRREDPTRQRRLAGHYLLGSADDADRLRRTVSLAARALDFPIGQINILDDSSMYTVGDAVCRAVVGMTAELGMSTTIEGIGDAAQLAAAKAHGFRFGQGYHWSPPIPAAMVDATDLTRRAPIRSRLMTEAVIDVVAFDAVSAPAATELLRPVCASTTWLDAITAARPYGSLDAVIERSDVIVAGLAWADVEQAMDAHPRIGERATGTDRESSWSRQEQSGASGANLDDTEALHAGNVAYEQHFGHVFLICATGRTPRQILDALNERLDNDEDTERQVVRRELAAIVRLRLAKALA